MSQIANLFKSVNMDSEVKVGPVVDDTPETLPKDTSLQALLNSPEVAEASEVREKDIEARREVEVLDLVDEVTVVMESLHASIEACGTLSKWDLVFIQHTVDNVSRQTGLKVATASLESEGDSARSISLEGLGSALKSIWDAIWKAVKSVWDAVTGFILKVLGFKKQKAETLEHLKTDLQPLDKFASVTTELTKRTDERLQALGDSPDREKVQHGKLLVNALERTLLQRTTGQKDLASETIRIDNEVFWVEVAPPVNDTPKFEKNEIGRALLSYSNKKFTASGGVVTLKPIDVGNIYGDLRDMSRGYVSNLRGAVTALKVAQRSASVGLHKGIQEGLNHDILKALEESLGTFQLKCIHKALGKLGISENELVIRDNLIHLEYDTEKHVIEYVGKKNDYSDCTVNFLIEDSDLIKALVEDGVDLCKVSVEEVHRAAQRELEQIGKDWANLLGSFKDEQTATLARATLIRLINQYYTRPNQAIMQTLQSLSNATVRGVELSLSYGNLLKLMVEPH